MNIFIKQALFLFVIGSITFTQFSMKKTLNYNQKKLPVNQNDANTKSPITYYYDSVKSISQFRFTNDAPGKQVAFSRILFPVFSDVKLNQCIKKTILSPFTIKHLCNSSLMTTVALPASADPLYEAASGYKKFTNNFIKQFESQAAAETLKAYWYADISTTVIKNARDYISCLCKADFFAGGLHDEYDYTYINYDRQKHKIISLVSQFKPDKINRLIVIAEQIFRHDEGLNSDQDLSSYFFDDEKYELTSNFTITDDGIKLLYIPNEIKPFASGTTELTIPFSAINDLVLPNSILANRIAGR